MSYGSDLAVGYCKLSTKIRYGWYPDPVLIVNVTAYIKKEKIQSGEIVVQDYSKGKNQARWDYKDLKITSVNIETPLATGLE